MQDTFQGMLCKRCLKIFLNLCILTYMFKPTDIRLKQSFLSLLIYFSGLIEDTLEIFSL